MVLAEQDDEWRDGRCYFQPESMALIDAPTEREEEPATLLMASKSIEREDDALLHHPS